MDRDFDRKAGAALQLGTCIFGLLFSVVWCSLAAASGAWFMIIFGLFFVGMMIFRLVVCIKKLQQSRQPAEPWEQTGSTYRSYTQSAEHAQSAYSETGYRSPGNNYCPYCGSGIQEDFVFCPKCGRSLN